jgi:hypothetical protein
MAVGVDQSGHDNTPLGIEGFPRRGPPANGFAPYGLDSATPNSKPAAGDDFKGRIAGKQDGVVDEGVEWHNLNGGWILDAEYWILDIGCARFFLSSSIRYRAKRQSSIF